MFSYIKVHVKDGRCTLWAFFFTGSCEEACGSVRKAPVLAPPYSPATLRGAGGESVPPCCRLTAAPRQGPEGPPAFPAQALRPTPPHNHTALDRPPSRPRARARAKVRKPQEPSVASRASASLHWLARVTCTEQLGRLVGGSGARKAAPATRHHRPRGRGVARARARGRRCVARPAGSPAARGAAGRPGPGGP